MIPEDVCRAAFDAAVIACDPTALVRNALAEASLSSPIVALAVGKAAAAMARGVPEVARGLCITHVDDGRPLPARWTRLVSAHPLPDATSVTAGRAALALFESTRETDTVLALVSGGASSLMEVPAPGVTLDELRRRTAEVMASGAPIEDLNRARTELSALKGGKLADRAQGPVVTLVVSDVVGDDPRVIGSGPTVRDGDRVVVIAPMERFGEQVTAALVTRGFIPERQRAPLTGDVHDVALSLAARRGLLVAWGEPTVRLPAQPGEGGRATQLALELARLLRGTDRSAFVAASDGRDGPTSAAGAYVDGTTWDRLSDPEGALARRDATAALASIGAVFTPGPTGINHADVVVLG